MTAASSTIEAPDVDVLVREIQRYLAVIRLFRQEGCEPCWRNDQE